MKDFKSIFKAKAHSKTLTREDMGTYCLLRAVAAKSEAKEEIARHFIAKAFTPGKVCAHRYHPYQSARAAGLHVFRDFTHRNKVFDLPLLEIFDTEEEIEIFKNLIQLLWKFSK